MPIRKAIVSLPIAVLGLILLTRCAARLQNAGASPMPPSDSSFIKIHTLPPCGQLYVDGKLSGVANIDLLRLSPGEHQFKMVIGKSSFDTGIVLNPGNNIGFIVDFTGNAVTATSSGYLGLPPRSEPKPKPDTSGQGTKVDSVWAAMRQMPGWSGIENTFSFTYANIDRYFMMRQVLHDAPVSSGWDAPERRQLGCVVCDLV